MSNAQNAFIDRALRQAIPRIWSALDIPEDSQALLYYRTLKTFASDLDFVYIGPRHDETITQIAGLALRLGLKPDLPTAFLTSRKLASSDFSLRHLFFFDGRCIEFGGASFDEHVKRWWADRRTVQQIWTTSAHPRLSAELAAWNGDPPGGAPTFPIQAVDFRRLQYRAITNLVFGLCCKCRIHGMETGSDDLWRGLTERGRLSTDDGEAIRDALAFFCHVRSLLHLRTARRWVLPCAADLKEIGSFIASQGCPGFDYHIRHLGRTLERIRRDQFGECVLPDRYETRFPAVDENWAQQKAVESYRQLAGVR